MAREHFFATQVPQQARLAVEPIDVAGRSCVLCSGDVVVDPRIAIVEIADRAEQKIVVAVVDDDGVEIHRVVKTVGEVELIRNSERSHGRVDDLDIDSGLDEMPLQVMRDDLIVRAIGNADERRRTENDDPIAARKSARGIRAR